jgi:hypothetical protein
MRKLKAYALLAGILFLLVGCHALTWSGCLKAEGSFFYCFAILSK